MKRVFRIDVSNREAFCKKMGALMRKAAKIGCGEVGYNVLGEGREYSCRGCHAHSDTLPLCACELPHIFTTDEQGYSIPVRRVRIWKYVEVAVWGEAPKYAGWTFAATLERLSESVNLVRSIVEVDLPEVFRSAPPKCDHCKLVRGRKDTFVMIHEDGRTIQVGRQCIRDFLGNASPEHIAEQARFVASLSGGSEEEGFGFGGRETHEDELEDVIAFAVREVAANGYRPKSSGMPPYTSDTVSWMMHGPYAPKQGYAPKPEPATEEEREQARKIIAYFAALEPKSDFEHNVSAIARAGTVLPKHYGYAVSLVCSYERAMGREAVRRAEKVARAASTYFGTEGKREVFTLTVTKILDLDGAYGTTHLHLFTDAAGNVAKWAASSERLEVGATYTVKATVKKHEEYKGAKQTVLSRCAAEVKKEAKS